MTKAIHEKLALVVACHPVLAGKEHRKRVIGMSSYIIQQRTLVKNRHHGNITGKLMNGTLCLPLVRPSVLGIWLVMGLIDGFIRGDVLVIHVARARVRDRVLAV